MPFPPSDAPSSKDLPRAVCSFPLPDFLPLPPSHPEVIALVRELEAVREFQTHHRRERKYESRSSVKDVLTQLHRAGAGLAFLRICFTFLKASW